MKNVRLTALAEFDLVEAQDFYAPHGAWVLAHFMESIDAAFADLARTAGIHPLHYGHHRMGGRISRFRCTTTWSAGMFS